MTLALGIGANTAIFSILYQVLLRPLPYPAADRLVFVWNTYPGSNLPQAAVSIPDYIDRKTQAPALEDATLFTMRSASVNERGTPEQLRALAVTPSFFTTLQRWPMLGRGFTEDEAKPNADRFTVITYGLWISHYGSDPSIVGRDIRVNGEAFRVVGVLPSSFELPSRDIALVVPFSFTPQQMSDTGRGNEFSSMIARLAPGATIEQANAQFKTIIARNLERLPQFQSFAKTSGFGGYAIPLRDQLVGDVRTPLYILQAGVVLVLLIACANVANLLLMRATSRQRELAIRTTLGAARGRIIRQLLTEGVVLSLAGGAAGLALGLAGVKAILALGATQIPGSPEASVNAPVLLFTLALAVLTGIVFGLVPAITIFRGNTAAFLKDDSTRGTAGRRTGRTRAALVVAETAIAVILLVGAGLLIKSFARLQQVHPGFSTDNVLTAQISLPASRYPTESWRRNGGKGLPPTRNSAILEDCPRSLVMKSSTRLIVAAALLASLAAGPAAFIVRAADETDPKAALQGRWKMLSSNDTEIHGDKDKPNQVTLTIDGDNFNLTIANEGGSRELAGGYTLDPTQTPQLIDFMIRGDNASTTVFGIYRISGDRLTIRASRATNWPPLSRPGDQRERARAGGNRARASIRHGDAAYHDRSVAREERSPAVVLPAAARRGSPARSPRRSARCRP